MDEQTLRLWFTFGIVVLGILTMLVSFLVAVVVFQDAEDPGEVIVAVLGPVGTAVGTLAGIITGERVGSAGRERAEHRAEVAQQRFEALATESDPSMVDQVREKHPELWPFV